MQVKVKIKEHDGKPGSRMIDTRYVAFIDRGGVDGWNDPRCVITMTDGTEIVATGTVEEIAKLVEE